MRWLLIFKFVVLLTVANGAPVIATKLFGNFLNQPLDLGASFVDGRPLLGHSKTVRGIILSLMATTAFAPILGFEWIHGLIIASAAMIGCAGAASRTGDRTQGLNRPVLSSVLSPAPRASDPA
jgi:hypothetical protein